MLLNALQRIVCFAEHREIHLLKFLSTPKGKQHTSLVLSQNNEWQSASVLSSGTYEIPIQDGLGTFAWTCPESCLTSERQEPNAVYSHEDAVGFLQHTRDKQTITCPSLITAIPCIF